MFFKKKVREEYGEKLLKCPRCRINMEKLKKENVIIDVCKNCHGMWLDNGEMEKLATMAKNHIKRGGKNGKK